MIRGRAAPFLSGCLLLATTLFLLGVPASAPRDAPLNLFVDLERVVNPGFQGLGYDLEPFLWSGANLSSGFDEDDWAAIRARMANGRPRWVITAVAMGWFHPAPEVWDWDSPPMRSLYRYLDAAQELDIHVQLISEWFQAEESWGWYLGGIPASHLPGHDLAKDPQVAAAAYSALLQHLLSMGYTVVKSLAITKEYMKSDEQIGDLYRALDERLRADGLRDQVLLAGPDASTPSFSSIRYAVEELSDILDVYTYHSYWEAKHLLMPLRLPVQGKPVWLTEFGWPSRESDFFIGLHMAEHVLVAMNGGISAAIYWTGQSLYRPLLHFESGFALWRFKDRQWVPKSQGLAFDLLSRFVERDSEVFAVASPSPQVHAAALRSPGGDYTLIFANLTGREHPISVEFSSAIDRQLHRYSYSISALSRTDGYEVPSDRQQRVSDRLDSTLPAHSIVVFTDRPDPRPIDLSPLKLLPTADGELLLTWQTARAASAEVLWESAEGSTLKLEEPSYRTGHSFRLRDLAPGTPHRVQVTARDDRGATATATIEFEGNGSGGHLPPVVGLAVLAPEAHTEPVASPNRLTLTWREHDDATVLSYLVYRGNAPDFSPTTANLMGTTDRERWVDVGLEPGRSYYYRVSPVGSDGRVGDPTTPVAGTVPLPPPPGLEERGGVIRAWGTTYQVTINRHTGLVSSLLDGDGYERLFGDWITLYESTPSGFSKLFGPFDIREVTISRCEGGDPRIEVRSGEVTLSYDLLPDRVRISASSASPRYFILWIPVAAMAGFQVGPLVQVDRAAGRTIDARWIPDEPVVVTGNRVSLTSPPSSYRLTLLHETPREVHLGTGHPLGPRTLWAHIPSGRSVDLLLEPVQPKASHPVPPTGLRARSERGAITLSWQPPEGGAQPIGYLVLRDGHQIARVPDTHYRDTNATPGERLYTIQSYDADGRISMQSRPLLVPAGLPLPGHNVASPTFGALPSASNRSGRGDPEHATDGLVRASGNRRGDHDGFRSELRPIFPVYFLVTLPTQIPVSALELQQIYAQDIGITRFNIQVSGDGQRWETVARVKEEWRTNGPEPEFRRYDFPEVQARHVRLEILAANLVWDSFAITELAVRSGRGD